MSPHQRGPHKKKYVDAYFSGIQKISCQFVTGFLDIWVEKVLRKTF